MIDADLERQRLGCGAARLDMALRALRDRAIYRPGEGPVPAPLREAIRRFSTELRTIEHRLVCDPDRSRRAVATIASGRARSGWTPEATGDINAAA